jgi:hypothetical protein
MVAQELVALRPVAPLGAAGRRPCGRKFTMACNKIPRSEGGSHELTMVEHTPCMSADGKAEESCKPADVKEESCTSPSCSTAHPFPATLARRLRDLVRHTRGTKAASAEACLQREIDPELLSEIATWEAVHLEIDGPDDVTDMVFTALRASGFTGKEKRFHELPR